MPISTIQCSITNVKTIRDVYDDVKGWIKLRKFVTKTIDKDFAILYYISSDINSKLNHLIHLLCLIIKHRHFSDI